MLIYNQWKDHPFPFYVVTAIILCWAWDIFEYYELELEKNN